jgi:DNA repair protein RecO (recombination protein O)
VNNGQSSTVPKAAAILLRKSLLTDTSYVVHWCTQEHGLIKTAAKGARRPGSPLAGRLDLFYECEIEYAQSKRGDLHTLREVLVCDYRHGLHTSYLRVLAAAYFVRLVEMVAEREAPIEAIHDLLRRGLNWLCGSEPTLKGVLHFERELAKALGLWAEGEPAPAIRAIQDYCHHLPEQRLTLLERLG